MVGEQPYKSRDMVGSDSGLGHLLVSIDALMMMLNFLDLNLFPFSIKQYIFLLLIDPFMMLIELY